MPFQDEILESNIQPPLKVGGARIDSIQGFKIASTSSFFGQTIFVLQWEEPYDVPGISHYEIFASNIYPGQTEPIIVMGTRRSPAIVAVTTEVSRVVVFRCSIVLTNGFRTDLARSPSCTGTTIAAGTTLYRTRRLIPFPLGPTIVSGGATTATYDNITCIVWPNTADSVVAVHFVPPDDTVNTQDLIPSLHYRASSAPGTTNNKVKLLMAFKVNNTPYSESSGDVITLANTTNWYSYAGTNNKLSGLLYSPGDLIQMQLRRDTSVANNAAVGFVAASVTLPYKSTG